MSLLKWQTGKVHVKMSALGSKVNKNAFNEIQFIKPMLCNRLLLVILQVFFNHLIPDHQSDGFQSPYKLIIPSNSTLLDTIVDFTLGGFARWDGQYFLHISTLGYTHENCLAFFPAYPLLLRFTSVFISFFSYHTLTYWNATLLSSIIINILCFVIGAQFLFLITVKLFGNSNFALRSWKLFCISPATIFFLAPYSESLFSALTFGGIYYCIEYKFVIASIFFAASGLTRSNGLINIGFLLYFALQKALRIKWKSLPTLTAQIVLSVTITVFPFLCYQYYAFSLFCFHKPHSLPEVIYNYLTDRNVTVRGERIPQWCQHSIPFSYSVIQSQYWNVGFLRYFEWKQLPNFLLAAPILSLVILYSLLFVKQNLLQFKSRPLTNAQSSSHPIFQRAAAVFAAHSIFLGLFTFFFAHVQISTRLIGSSCPAVYWMMSWMMNGTEASKRNVMEQWDPLRQKDLSLTGKLVRFYCLFYVVVGTGMFVNHLPWT